VTKAAAGPRPPWSKRTLIIAAALAVAAVAVATALIWPITDLIAAHDVGAITGATRAARLQTAREAVRTQLLTLGAGVFAAGALIFTAQNFRLARSTFNATETRVLNERFIAISKQLGDDHAAVQLAGIQAMAGLADDWPENRQTCIDVICAYLRMPPVSPREARLAAEADQQVRHTAIRVIAAHLRPGAKVSWQGRDLDFTGVRFDGGDFSGAEFSGGAVAFTGASFSGTDFSKSVFSSARVSFAGVRFGLPGDRAVSFHGAVFSGGEVSFAGSQFSSPAGEVPSLYRDVADFGEARFSGGTVHFSGASFYDGRVGFERAAFCGGRVGFGHARFLGGNVDFSKAAFSAGEVGFGSAEFGSGRVDFSGAVFSGGTVGFGYGWHAEGHVYYRSPERDELPGFTGLARFSGADVRFTNAEFSGSELKFVGVTTTGGTVDFSQPRDWSHPPAFDFRGTPPAEIRLPGTTA
jgi:uncharacterized protein YjbI with pentapeptide repeats